MLQLNRPIPTPTPVQAIGAVASQTHQMGTIFPSAARAATTYTSDAFENLENVGARFFINITDVTGGGTVTVKVQNFDPASQTWIDVPEAVTTALAAVAGTTLTVYPGIEEDPNVCIAIPLGRKWRLHVTVAVATTTFSIGGDYLG